VNAPLSEAGTLAHLPLFSNSDSAAYLKLAEDASFFPMIFNFSAKI
jgi:hypothetical protein